MKTKLFLLILLISVLSGCSEPQENLGSNTSQTDSLTKILKSAGNIKPLVNDTTFLALFPYLEFDTLHIYSPNEKATGKKFEGALIDSAFHRFFFFDAYLKGSLKHGDNIFSCYKFKISENRTGLIARTPSQYVESAIDLFIWDNRAKKIIKKIELADSFGDAEWYFVKDAWLTDINKDGRLDIITRRKDSWREDVNVGYGKLHITDSIYAFQATGNDFKKIKISVDTSKFKLLDWPKW